MIVHKLLATLKKDAITGLRYRHGFLVAIVSQLVQLATFYYLARAVGPQFRPEGVPYFLFLLVGTGFYTFLLAGIHAFLRGIQEPQQTGTLEVLLTTATPAPVLVFLNAVSAFAAGALQLILYLCAGIIIFHPALHANMPACVLIFFLSVLLAVAVGLFAAGLQVWIQKGSSVLWLLGAGAWLMSGTLFPVSALPKAARLVSFAIPFTHSLSAMRMALLSPNSALLTREVALLGMFAVLLVPAGTFFFSATVHRARQNGTLSFY
jgi:ABC-type polysaccharide/polyol phosphate export permease